MTTSTHGESITIRATTSSYVVLGGVWVALAAVYVILGILHPGKGLESGALVAGAVALTWWTWLTGFKITMRDGYLEYRDGLFRSSRMAVSDIVNVKDDCIEWNMLARKLRVPRLTVMTINGRSALQINPKPFGRHDLQRIREMLEDQNQRTVRAASRTSTEAK